MPDEVPLLDQAERHHIVSALDETLFVSAGAGSGKTNSLVQRIMALVLDGGVELRSVAAITFTEKAAAELRDRLRHAFERASAHVEGPGDRQERAEVALGQLDGAAISTLHAFAQRLLREHPIEAGLPPGVEVLDEIASEVEFERRWSVWLDEMLERALHDPHLRRALTLAGVVEIGPKPMRQMASALNANWDRVEDRIEALSAPPPLPDIAGEVASLAVAAAELAERRHAAPEDDTLTAFLDSLPDYARRLADADDDVERLLE